jgi:hypothetical protein
MKLPIDDWQFWVATAIAAGALWIVLRMLFPSGIPFTKKRRSRGRTRATLTVKGRAVDQKAPSRPE